MLAVLALATIMRTAPSTVHYASPDAGPSAFCDCVKQLQQPGDECQLRAGRYEVGAARCEVAALRGTEAQPMRITSAGDGEVVIDGTLPIAGPWTAIGSHYAAPSGGHEILQFFIDGELQVLARFPNAAWSDKGVFYAVKNWLRSKAPGIHNLSSGVGLLRDQGKCQLGDTPGTCNSHDLALSGINATGALGVLNLYSCDTGIQRITRHDASDPSVLHYDATWKGLCDDYRGGFGRYFLEGKDEFLDHEEEWLLDLEQKIVKRTSPPPHGAEVRGRVSDYALTVNGSSWLEVSNISFHATTLSVTGDVSNVTLSALEFNYSAVSRRSLGQETPPVGLAVWRDTTLDRRMGHNCCSYMDNSCCSIANLLIEDVIVRYSDGPALMVAGSSTTLRDCLFEWNDWTAVGGSWPLYVPTVGKAHRATTVWADDTEGLVIDRLTFRDNGAAQSINAGGSTTVAPRVVMCSFESQLAIQDDGSFVEGGGRPSTTYIRNWCTNTGKGALRWDGYYQSHVNGGVMFENVAWNTSALMIKGDQHNVTRNTAFGGADTSSSSAIHDRPKYQDHLSSLDNLSIPSATIGVGRPYTPLGNALSVFTQNIFDSAAIKGNHNPENATLPGTWLSNLLGHVDLGANSGPNLTFADSASPATKHFDIRAELRDPYHHDFRPCPDSQAAALSAGAYQVWTAVDAEYWIPGRRERMAASTPVPPAGSIGVHLNTELMFLPSRLALSHSVYFGKAGSPPLHLEHLSGPVANIARFRANLEPSTHYVWRVDTHTVSGVKTGNEWSLMTGAGELSCKIAPHPPPQPAPDKPPAPGPGQCPKECNQLCPGLAGKGEKCEACVLKHSSELHGAGCWTASGKGGRHAFVLAFCGAIRGSCAAAMAAACAGVAHPTQCDACAAEHQHDLRVAGCTGAEIKQWCDWRHRQQARASHA